MKKYPIYKDTELIEIIGSIELKDEYANKLDIGLISIGTAILKPDIGKQILQAIYVYSIPLQIATIRKKKKKKVK